MTVASLGDDTLARELMEEAILQTTEHLEALGPVGADQAQGLLARHFRNAVRRKSRDNRKFSSRGTAADVEAVADPVSPAVLAIEAELDIETLLHETSPELRRAMLMRYGARSSWRDVARETSKSTDAIRMSCLRELNRIRKKLGIGGKAK